MRLGKRLTQGWLRRRRFAVTAARKRLATCGPEVGFWEIEKAGLGTGFCG